MWTRALPLALGLAQAIGAGAGSAETPRTALDWLTAPEGRAALRGGAAIEPVPRDGRARVSGTAPPETLRPLQGPLPPPVPFPEASPDLAPGPPPAIARAIPTRPVTVTPLGPADAGAAGVLPPSVSGLPRTLWAGSDPARLARLIEALPRARVPAIEALAQTLMMAEADPPRGAAGVEAEGVLMARIDQLIERGALEAARALLERAGSRTPERRRRAFDVALLLDDETAACRAVESAPRSQADYARRVFCLARGGDWPAGALTFDGARALGALDPVEGALLAAFLDDELDDAPLPAPPPDPSPLAFRLFDALGQPVPTGGLPIAFAYGDLREVAGWKAQLEAAERLARAGAIEGNRLLALLTARAPSASGGVWDRVAAIQSLDAALAARNPEAVAGALPPAWRAMAQAGTQVALAAALAPRLEGIALQGEAARLARRLALLAPGYEAAARGGAGAGAGAGGREAEALAAIARGERPERPGRDPLMQAVAAGFDGGPAPERLARLAREDRLGEALLAAVGDVAAAADGGLDALPGALRFLRRAGLEDTARRAALQLLILRA